MMIKKSQYNIIYLIFVIAVSISIFGGVYALSGYTRDLSSEKFGNFIIDSITARLEEAIMEMRLENEKTFAVNITKTISIPDKIGNQQYQITGENSTLILRTYGTPSLVRVKNIGVWNVNITGFVFSAGGKAELSYSQAGSRIMIK